MTRISISLFSIFFLFFLSCSDAPLPAEKLIKDKMIEQQKCWNKGDIDGFMKCYWENDSLRFIGSRGINYGWQTTLDNYKKSYPSKEDMGILTFTFEDITVFTATEAYVVGKWHLDRQKKEDVGGYFSLIWNKKNGKWVIVSDHTS